MTRNSNPGGHAVILEQTEHTTGQDDTTSEEFQRFENLAGKLVHVEKAQAEQK